MGGGTVHSLDNLQRSSKGSKEQATLRLGMLVTTAFDLEKTDC